MDVFLRIAIPLILLIALTGLGRALHLLRRTRDSRFGFLALLFTFIGLHQGWELWELIQKREAPLDISPEMLVGVAFLTATFLLLRYVLTSHRQTHRLSRQLQEITTLHAVAMAATRASDQNDLLERIVQILDEALPGDLCGLLLLDEATQTFRPHSSCRGLKEGDSISVEGTLAGQALREGRALLLAQSPDGGPKGAGLLTPEGRAGLAAPVHVGGRPLGVLYVESQDPHAFSPEDPIFLDTLASHLSAALERVQLLMAERQRRREAETLQAALRSLVTVLDLKELLERILEQLAHVVPYDSASVFLREGEQLRIVAVRNHPHAEEIVGQTFRVDEDELFQEILRTRRPLILRDAQADPRFHTWGGTDYVRGWMGVPLIARGQVIGNLTLDSRRPGAYDEEQAALAQAFANQAAIALENARLFEELRRSLERERWLVSIAHTLTGLSERSALLERLVVMAVQAVNADAGALALVSPDGERMTYPYLFNLPRTLSLRPAPKGRGLAWEIVRTGRSFLLKEYADHPSALRNWIEAGVRSFLGVPILVGERRIGALGLFRFTPSHPFDEDERVLAEAIGRQAGVVIANFQLLDEARRRAAQQEALNAVIAAAAGATELKGLLELALTQTLKAMDLQAGAIWIPPYVAFSGLPEDVVNRVREAFRNRPELRSLSLERSVAIEDWRQEEREGPWAALASVTLSVGIRASLTVPILADGVRVGGLSLASFTPRTWSQEEIALAEAVGRQLGNAVRHLQLLEQIRSQAEELDRILRTVPEGILLLDAEGHLRLANPRARECLQVLNPVRPGERLEHLGGRPIEELLRPPSETLWHEIVVTGPHRRIFEVAAHPLFQGQGWVLVLRDVTQEREAQERLQQQEQLAIVGQLAAGIAHDFNNLLMGIIGYAQLLEAEEALSDRGREFVALLIQQSQRAAQLVRQLLDFSRRSLRAPQPLELIPFFKEAVRFLERTLPETIRVIFDYEPGERYVVHADPTQLQQVLTNLALNARDAMPEGGELRIRLSRIQVPPKGPRPLPDLPPGPWILWEVEDTGTGIPPEILPRIFEPFFTTKPPGEGTGLGLAQVYGLVKQHGGYIDVESRVGEGTRFLIYLPPLEVPGEEQPEDRAELPRGARETILVVEDEPAVQQVLRNLLERLGYRVILASDGEEALEIFRKKGKEIALVIADVVMPRMRGGALVQALRKEDPQVRVLLISGYPLGEVQQKLFEGQGIPWLQKPFGMRELAEKVAEILQSPSKR